jgi:Meiotically up-regulated gene 113
VKIGYTIADDVAPRVAALQAGSRLHVLHTEPGTVRDGRTLHTRFASLRLHGEWFALEGVLADWLDERRPPSPPRPATRQTLQVLAALDGA